MSIEKPRRKTMATRRNYDALNNALLTLMKDKDFVSITVIEICSLANVPRATFYNYFDDKYGILKYSFKRIAEEISELAGEPGAPEYFENLATNVLNYVEKNRAVISNLWNADEGIGLAAIQNMLRMQIKDNFEAHGYKLRIPLDLISGVYASSVMAMIKWWLENSGNYDKRQIVDYLTVLVDPSRFM